MAESLKELLSGYIGFNQGWVLLRWEFLACLCAICTSVFVVLLGVSGAARDRARELGREQQGLHQRLERVGAQLREVERSFGPVRTVVDQAAALRAEAERPRVARLRLNADGSIVEYA